MTEKRHKADTKDFGEMTIAEQARSLNATVTYLERALRRHLKDVKKKDEGKTKKSAAKRVAQIERLRV